MKAVITIIVSLLAAAAMGFDLESSRGPGAGRTIMLSESSALDLASVPTGGIVTGGYRFDFGYNRRYEVGDLDQVFIAGAFRYRNVSLAIGGSQFGDADLYAEQTYKATVAYHYRRYVFGLIGSVRNFDFGGNYANLSATTLGMGGAVRFQKLFFALTIDNLTRPRLYDAADKTAMTYTLHGELIGKANISTLVNAEIEQGQTARLALGQRIPLSDAAGLYWGICTAPLEYGGGFDFSTKRFDLSYMVSIHPTLGVTHTIGFGFGSKPARSREAGEFE